MCGIFGYSGHRDNASQIVLEGLKRLDYRGYDSWGIATNSSDGITIEKQVGKIGDVKALHKFPKSTAGIAHTRWATTGKVTNVNAHPHFSTDKSFALAQNGIVENYQILKKKLQKKGYMFISETDTEVITRLVEDKLKQTKDLKKAVSLAFAELEGRNTIILITNDNQIIAARNGSPLVIGFNPDTKEVFLSSDTLSFANYAKKMLVVDNGQMVHVNGFVKLYTISDGKELPYEKEDIGFTTSRVDKEGYEHFMLKEIHETPKILIQLTKQDENNYQSLAKVLTHADNIYVVGSGSAGVAASQVAFYLRNIGKIKAIGLVGADAVEYFDLFTKKDIIIAISQSGETADVLEVLEEAHKKGVKIASLVNMPGSMMTRMSDYKCMSESGPEICVMATKSFASQIMWGYLLAKTVGGKLGEGRQNVENTAHTIDVFLKDKKSLKTIQSIAKMLTKKHDVFLLGKYQNFNIIREGMVKIIEGAYKHAHALPAGDLKHYVITLMEKGVPVIAVVSNDRVKADMMTAINEVRLRGAEVTAIASEKLDNFDHYIEVPNTGETSGVVNLVALQLFAYYMALYLGNNIDKPRNIAKSVTVK